MQRNLKRWEDSIEIAANKVGIEAALLKAVVAVESHFNANAQSNSGPVGLTQILPSTARTLGFSKDQLKFPEVNLEAGALYLKVQLTQFGNQDLAVIAYNLGGKTQTLNKKSQRHANLYANEVMSIYEYFKAREKILEQSNTN
ncbi:hypothetical protein A4F89_02155 [Polynucleobacter asymbioticus]|jgi:soluble lytic murein transglycosylase-like protein|uniref:Transglycosylase SLT domain-containing protein n=2 Tax=Polynucleobacter asymbioticus TaxID=576611 RepID=A0AAC9NI91_9BURK|nr:lytic transglycosylase domain-containing protein [Polynucleobacter asymbioticus]APB98223.1 hypothetical protein A4F89_02155 [Polynucleobacter asymbioticus]APC00509.1 hypothetical protein AOC25_02160 [Polynucleobacter asymbioticus]